MELTLPVLISAAAVDAVNPCAFAVLIILLTTILATNKRGKALGAGLAFSLSVFISYILMGLGLFTAIQFSGANMLVYKGIGLLAVIVGLANIKDYVSYGAGGFVMEVPLSWRPTMKKIIKSVTSVPGAFAVGFVVSLFLLPCTSGPYVVVLGMLAKESTRVAAMPLLLLYNAIFVTPMVGLTLLVYFGLATTEKAEKWRTERIRYLHLFAGILMLAVGVALLAGWI